MALGTAMQKIESAIWAIVLGVALPFIITFLFSGGQTSSFLLPCASPNTGVCQVGTISGNTITLPAILVSMANQLIILLEGILLIWAMVGGIWGIIEYLRPSGGGNRGGAG